MVRVSYGRAELIRKINPKQLLAEYIDEERRKGNELMTIRKYQSYQKKTLAKPPVGKCKRVKC